jgi:hypothetical protein
VQTICATELKPQDVEYERTVRITQTWIGQYYCWDTLADVNWSMLRHNLECAVNVLENPAKFPHADDAAIQTKIEEHELFLTLYSGRE